MLSLLEMRATSQPLEVLKVQLCSRKCTVIAAGSQQGHQARQQLRQLQQLSSERLQQAQQLLMQGAHV
jgi:hypothetical protein